MQGAPIPAGYAVVGELLAPGCAPSNNPERRANAWSVKLPGSQETVCKDFPIPRGYVVAAETSAAACPATATDKNAWVITKTRYIETRRAWIERP